jgi:hypothetical protein
MNTKSVGLRAAVPRDASGARLSTYSPRKSGDHAGPSAYPIGIIEIIWQIGLLLMHRMSENLEFSLILAC